MPSANTTADRFDGSAIGGAPAGAANGQHAADGAAAPAVIVPRTAPGEEITATPGGHLRIPVLDGVRGLAILMVIADHATRLPEHTARVLHAMGHWGYTGVDLFFVLSGFLITGILYEAKGGGRYFRNFYARRVLRIFPVYYACLIFGLIIFPHLPVVSADWIGPMYTIPHKSIWTFWAYLSNFSIGHLPDGQARGMLDATWSLAIEEQFYLVWPLVVLLLARKQLMGLCLVLIVAAHATRAVFVMHNAPWLVVYTNPFCRMDDLAAGAFVALAARGPKGIAPLRKWAMALFAIGCVGLLLVIRKHGWKVGWFGAPGLTTGYSLVAVVYASGLVLLVGSGARSIAHRVFASGFLRLFGRYSYAMYLFHMATLWLVGKYFCEDQYSKDAALLPIHGSYVLALAAFYICGVLLTLAAALVSWNLLERHCLALKRYFRDDVRAAPAGARQVLS